MTKKDTRLYLRINSRLKKKAEEYAKRNDTSMSLLVTRFFERLLQREAQRAADEVKP